MEQKPNESNDDYVKRLIADADKAINNLNHTFSDMKRDGIIGFCKNCGCNIYENKRHKC